ncbi:hypothetical protein BsWGS_28091 [Bradybaena similaris]
MNKQRVLKLGITAGVVIAGGIIMSVLLYQMVITRAEGQRGSPDEGNWKRINSISAVVSALGLVYIVPGLIGLIAAFVQNKCMYITTCIFTMICLLIMALVIVFGGFTIIVLIFRYGSISGHCIDEDDTCQCRSSLAVRSYSSYEKTAFKTCVYYEKFVALTTALIVVIILTWIAVLVEFVIACYFTCRSKATAGTVIMTPQQQPFLQPGPAMAPQGYVQGYPLQDYRQGYPPPSYDQDQAVSMKV